MEPMCSPVFNFTVSEHDKRIKKVVKKPEQCAW